MNVLMIKGKIHKDRHHKPKKQNQKKKKKKKTEQIVHRFGVRKGRGKTLKKINIKQDHFYS